MIDIIKAKKYFNDYVSNYDLNVAKIKLKVVHTYNVAENARKIARGLNLSEEQQDLAELIGLLHDIGRFEQVRIYHTFSDKKSVDHAEKGADVLFKDNEIRKFLDDSKYDVIIDKAIRNHNKFVVEEGLSEQELLHAKIIRDADKLDIFRAFLDEKLEDLVLLEVTDLPSEVLSPETFDMFKEEKPMLYSKCKTNMDFMVAIIAFIYDLNFNESLTIIKENDYIHKLVEKINARDEYTRTMFNKVLEYSMDYINRKLEGN